MCVHRVYSVLGLQGQHAANGAETCLPLEANLPLLADPFDDSTNGNAATTWGDAFIADGAHFDGSGDYLTVPNFEYTTDGQFSVGMWFTKEGCSGNIYEYLFSQSLVVSQSFSTPNPTAGAPNPSTPNPNVHFYVGCEHSGGGWSNLGGTIIRTNLYDDDGTAVMFDYPAWDASSFSAVTNVWISAILVVDQSEIAWYINGERVDDSAFGFFNGGSHGTVPYECINNAGCNQRTGEAILSSLTAPINTITMETDIYLGGRMDLNEDRHFHGKIAGVTISNGPMTAAEITCLFTAYNGLLPAIPQCDAMVAEMMMGGNFELELQFLGDSGLDDQSGKNREIATFGGDVIVSDMGAVFDGDGDYITISNFDYESDGDFTISFWITKDDCNRETPFEYLYSHVQNTEGDHVGIQDRLNSNINLYIGCESPLHDVASSVAGSVIRFNMIDSAGTATGPGSWVLYDYPLNSAVDFDGITHEWVHVTMTVTRHAVNTYINGRRIEDRDVGFPTGTECDDMHLNPTCPSLLLAGQTCDTDMSTLTGGDPAYQGQHLSDYCQNTCETCTGGEAGGTLPDMIENIAYPYPSELRAPLEDFDLRSPIYVGARFDLDPARHFLGSLALLTIYSSPMTNAEASCMFQAGDAALTVAANQHRRALATYAPAVLPATAVVTATKRDKASATNELGEPLSIVVDLPSPTWAVSLI